MSMPVNVEEFEDIARDKLAQPVYDYYAGGADDEITLRENRLAFQRRQLRYRVLHNVSTRSLETELLGHELPFPVILAPTALHRMAHPDGEIATARGVKQLGVLQTVSSISSVRLEDIAAEVPGSPRWFQLYVQQDRELTETLVRRAYDAGYEAIVLTVDLPLLGKRERDLRNIFVIPEGVKMANFEDDSMDASEISLSWTRRVPSAALSWSDIPWISSLSPLPLVLKGIIRGDDAVRGVDAGAAAIWISNHGGRQLDTSITGIDALPQIAEAVGGRVPLIVDGGVRRGTDVLKAIALGATAVAIGRPQLWGLAAGGSDGVRQVLELFRDELSLAMALCGCASISEIDSSLLA